MKMNVKRIALMGGLMLAVSMLAACQVGANYSAEMKGDASQIYIDRKDAIVSVPYTGGTPVEEKTPADPYEAGLVDENGYLTESGKKWDKNGNGIDDDFPDVEGAGDVEEGAEEGAEEGESEEESTEE